MLLFLAASRENIHRIASSGFPLEDKRTKGRLCVMDLVVVQIKAIDFGIFQLHTLKVHFVPQDTWKVIQLEIRVLDASLTIIYLKTFRSNLFCTRTHYQIDN